jgi:hypothetical protein
MNWQRIGNLVQNEMVSRIVGTSLARLVPVPAGGLNDTALLGRLELE